MTNDEYRAKQAERRQHGLKARHELRLENATYTAAEVKVLTDAARREADGYDLVERFWEAGWPTLAACPEECGTCKPCVARWAVTWSLAALSNPDLVAKAEADGPWEWTTKPIPVTSNRPPDSRTCNCDSPNPYVGPWHAVGCCTLYAPSATYTESDMRVLTEAALRLGRKEQLEEVQRQFERITYASDDGTEFEHTHPAYEGEPECPACWVQHIRQILGVNLPPKSERPLHVMSCGDCRADLDVRDHYPDCGQMYAPQAAERGSDGLTGSGEGPATPRTPKPPGRRCDG